MGAAQHEAGYWDYRTREDRKAEAWPILRNNNESPPARTWALMTIIQAHYWRAREDLERMPKAIQRRIHGKRYSAGYELDIDVYTRHWLYANIDIPTAHGLLEWVEELWSYKPEQSKYLHRGQTSYAALQAEAAHA